MVSTGILAKPLNATNVDRIQGMLGVPSPCIPSPHPAYGLIAYVMCLEALEPVGPR